MAVAGYLNIFCIQYAELMANGKIVLRRAGKTAVHTHGMTGKADAAQRRTAVFADKVTNGNNGIAYKKSRALLSPCPNMLKKAKCVCGVTLKP